MGVFGLLTPYSGVLKPLVYWPYQSVRLHNVMTEHIYIKMNIITDKSYVLFIKRGCYESRTIQIV